MRLYTIETNGMTKVAVGMDDAMYTVDSFGVDVRDMNELICNWSQLGDVIRQKLANVDVSPVTDYKILAPIIRPLQDVACRGDHRCAGFQQEICHSVFLQASKQMHCTRGRDTRLWFCG